MSEVSTETVSETEIRRDRKPWKWSILLLVVAVFVTAWVSIRVSCQQVEATQVALKKQNIITVTVPRGPDWIHVLGIPKIVEIQLKDISLSSLDQDHFSNGLSSVERVMIFNADFTANDLDRLKELRYLELISVTNGSIDKEALSKLTMLQQLKTLYFHKTDIRDSDLEFIGELSSIQSLAVTDAEITDTGLKSLHRHPNLKMINLGHTNITANGATELQNSIPECTIFYR